MFRHDDDDETAAAMLRIRLQKTMTEKEQCEHRLRTRNAAFSLAQSAALTKHFNERESALPCVNDGRDDCNGSSRAVIAFFDVMTFFPTCMSHAVSATEMRACMRVCVFSRVFRRTSVREKSRTRDGNKILRLIRRTTSNRRCCGVSSWS